MLYYYSATDVYENEANNNWVIPRRLFTVHKGWPTYRPRRHRGQWVPMTMSFAPIAASSRDRQGVP